MQVLTREQAIKRIKELDGMGVPRHIRAIPGHLEMAGFNAYCGKQGAINELMAIFDIKEEELK